MHKKIQVELFLLLSDVPPHFPHFPHFLDTLPNCIAGRRKNLPLIFTKIIGSRVTPFKAKCFWRVALIPITKTTSEFSSTVGVRGGLTSDF